MQKWSSYIGFFSGTLFIGLGIALRYLPVPATAPWMQEVVPYFLIGYGVLRIGLSVYFLRRRNRTTTLLATALLFLWHCNRGPEKNLLIRFPYDGECASCPLVRMDSLLRFYFPQAVVQVSFDSAQQDVILHLDSHYVRIDTLVQVLLAYGYEVNDQLPSDPFLSSCCTPIEASIQTEGGANVFADANPREEVSLLEQELEAQLSEEPSLPHEEISLDDDISDLENFDIQDATGETGLEEGLDDFDLDEDLELDAEPKPKKSNPKKPQ